MVANSPRHHRPSHNSSTAPTDCNLTPGGFAPIPSGWIVIGSANGQADEQPLHHVWIDAFEMAVFPVTHEAYGAFLVATGHPHPRGWGAPALSHPEQPVVGVSWHDAVAYCNWRSANGRPAQLPTEAQWERAARGRRHGRRYPWGDTIPEWVPNGGRGPLDGPWPVTLGEPNDFGLFGIAANIHEWCTNWHAVDFYERSPALNPSGPVSGVRRASRGGAWRHAITVSPVASRSKLDPTYRYTDFGFRLARSTPRSP
ncbi:MAG: formylglycine-generating enzyme family protein [Vicinamibacterales bacterium]|nr:formylglycine-generating enzyme family protein [Vicinamibacterales bacterium]